MNLVRESVVLTNLPAAQTHLIGRKTELEALRKLLTDDTTRLLTVFGPGGMGKTQLALSAAREVLEVFQDGVYLLELSGPTNSDHLVNLIADNLQWRFYSDGPMYSQLLDFLQSQQMLLIVDNAEYLTDSVAYITEILKHAPGVKILATSRAKLNLYAETLFPLSGLTYPSTAEPLDANSDAVELFVQRSRAVRPDFQLTAQSRAAIIEICQLTQGMPLALVMAASWMLLLSPEAIASEIRKGLSILETDMRDVPERQRSIRAIFDYTWEQLSPADRAVFARFAVFRRGFSREAAERVAQGSLRTLLSLLKSAVIQTTPLEGRYEVHELLRQYAAEKLEQAGELAAVSAAHSQYFLEFTAKHAELLKGQQQIDTLNALQADEENIRLAWETGVQQGNIDGLSAALEGLFWFCVMRSREQLFDALAQLTRESLVARQTDDDVRVFLAQMQLRLRWSQRWRDGSFVHHPAVLDELDSMLNLFNGRGLKRDAAMCTLMLGDALRTLTDDIDRAASLHREAVQAFTAQGDDFYAAWAFHFHAKLVSDTQAVGKGIDLLNQGLALRRKHNDQIGMAYSLYNLSVDLLLAGKLDECAQVTDEVISLSKLTGENSTLLMAQIIRGLLALLAGNLDDTKKQNAANQRVANSLNRALAQAWVNMVQGLIECLQGRPGDAVKLLEASSGMATQPGLRYFVHLGLALAQHQDNGLFERYLFSAIDQARGLVAEGALLWCLPPLAMWESQHGDAARAAELLGAVNARPESVTGWLNVWLKRVGLIERLRSQLDERAFEAASTRGQTLDIANAARAAAVPYTPDEAVTASDGAVVSARAQAANQNLIEPLSDRELQVLTFIGRGLSNREIASEMFVELSTVKKHLTHIYDKLAVSSRAQAILRAQELRLI